MGPAYSGAMRTFVGGPGALVLGIVPVGLGGFYAPLLGACLTVAWVVAWVLARRWLRGGTSRSRAANIVLGTALGLAVAFIVAQAVPYGRSHSNPAVSAEPAWDTAATRELAVVACFDCHSNETSWPWYADVAPMSWLTYSHVQEGRATLNFSDWNRRQRVDDVAEAIRQGAMPPLYYRILHPGSALTDAAKEQLIEGLRVTFQASPPGG